MQTTSVSNNVNTKYSTQIEYSTYKIIYLLKINKNIAEKPEIQEFNETTSTKLIYEVFFATLKFNTYVKRL